MRISVKAQQIFNFDLQLQRLGQYWQQGLSLVFAAFIVIGLWQVGWGQALENWSYNTFLNWRGTVPWHPSIAIVEVDEASLHQQLSLGSRQLYAALIDRLAATDPAVIALTTLFAGQEPEDAQLAAAMSRHGQVVLAQAWTAEGQPILTSPMLKQAATAIGHIHQVPDSDGITRFVPTEVAGIPALGLATTRLYASHTATASPSIRPDQRIWLNWHHSLQQATRYPATAVLNGEVSAQHLHHKIILIGTAAFPVFAPSAHASYPVHLHATVISNLLQQEVLVPISRLQISWVLLVISAVLLSVTTKWRWFPQLLLWLGASLAWAGVSWVEFNANIWLPIATPILWFGSTGAAMLTMKFLFTFQNLRRNETRYALMMQGFNQGVWDWDLKNNQFYFSPSWKQMIGYSETSLSNLPQEWFDRVHPLDRPILDTAISAYLQGGYLHGTGSHFEHEYRLLHQDGSYRWMQIRGVATYNAAGRAERLVGSQIDITAQKQAEEELWRSTFFDRLTDLPSWTGFVNHLQQAITQAQLEVRPRFAVLWIDLDQFKLVNNNLGSTLGDRLLIAIAQRLKSFLAPEAVVARLGEDEFAVLVKQIQDGNDAIRMAERIQQMLACPFNLDDHEMFVTASIGIALSSSHYLKPEHLLRDAGAAMYRAKAMGRPSYLVFDKSMRTGMLVKLRLENDLRRAIAEGERQSRAIVAMQTGPHSSSSASATLLSTSPDTGLTVTSERYPELELYYQPIVRLSTGEVAGFEALVRWQHAEQGLLFPSRFISVAEETGLIIPLSWWILRTACRQMNQWRMLFPENSALTMSVNLSSKQFSMPGLTEQIQKILKESNLEPTYLKLELTESMVMENVSSVVDVLYQLRALGIRLAIDDFGTGYSSLSYLPRFPLTTLKIDRSFVDQIGACHDNLEVVRTILALAHNLRMDVVAEGVETEAQASRLRDMGCEYGQGYFFYKPLDVDAATKLLANNSLLQKPAR